jgi:pentose-5-phosphate-3-epimerase
MEHQRHAHKPGKKLRPITSNIDAPSEIVAKRLAYQFNFHVENTQDAIKKLQDIQIEDDECTVSFDVTAFITDIDSVDSYVELTKMCMLFSVQRSLLSTNVRY